MYKEHQISFVPQYELLKATKTFLATLTNLLFALWGKSTVDGTELKNNPFN